jgi:hypothetical protein
MFDVIPETSAPPPPGGGQAGLLASTIAGWHSSLAEALHSPSELDDEGRMDAMRALEGLACTITAAQAALAAELDTSVRAEEAAAGVRADDRGKGVASMVARARPPRPPRAPPPAAAAR